MQVKVGPTAAPGRGYSARPAEKRSISWTFLQQKVGFRRQMAQWQQNHLLVQALKSLSLRGRHVLVQLVPLVNFLIKAKLKIVSVASNSVISTAVNVESGQVQAVGIVLWSVQVVLHVRSDEGVSVLRSLANQSSKDSVQLALVETEWVEEELAQSIARSFTVWHNFRKNTVD